MVRNRAQCTSGSLLVLGLAAVPSLYFLLVTTFATHGLVNGNGNVAGEDFAQIWLGGRLAIEGRIHEIFAPELFKAAARAAFSAPHVPAIFSYPPTTLVPAAAMAFLPYPLALSAWSALQVGLFTAALLVATRRFLPANLAVLIAATSPILALTLPWGQFGSVIAALMTLAVLQLDRRPVLAGVLFGLMAVKPQFGVFVPVALLAGGHWRAFLAASLTVAALALLPMLLFGSSIWVDFFRVTLPAQMAITSDPHNYLPIAHSIRDRLLIAGLDPSAARTVQIGVACLALAAVALAFRRALPAAHRLLVLAAATLAALPYVALYDQGVVALAALALVAADTGRLDRSTRALLLFLWASPIVDLWLTLGGLPQIGPFAGPVAIVLALASERATVDGAISPRAQSAPF
jgi:glycosyl transferase family 87